MEAAAHLINITRSFGRKTAVNGLNLTIPAAGLYGITRPNGTGNTITICAALRFAANVPGICLLMDGKPPGLVTLFRRSRT